MNKNSYQFNYSQDIVHLQTKFSLFNRVSNILFTVSFDHGFNQETMQQAVQLTVDRNDCLRLTFIKEGKQIRQYFEPKRIVESIPSYRFDTYQKMEAFIKRFRRNAVNIFKGKAADFVFVTDPSGKQQMFVKISHYAADTYGIGIIVNDLCAIYNALRTAQELPPPTGKFETLLEKDADYRANAPAVEKDREFFKEYYEQRHPERPSYCGIHGGNSDRWLKLKRKGAISLPYLFVKCDTKGYRFVIPSSITSQAAKWCEDNGISMNSFFFYTCAIVCSLRNDKAKYQLPLELLNCRATIADKKAAGTKVQSLSVYTTVDYEKSFNDNIAIIADEQNELYRHTRLSYLEIQDIEHKLWNYSMLSQITNFCFSFIPMNMPDGLDLQVYSNGKGALPAYIALIWDTQTNEIYVNYDVQTEMCSAEQLIEFQNIYIRVIESVLKNPDTKLEKLF